MGHVLGNGRLVYANRHTRIFGAASLMANRDFRYAAVSCEATYVLSINMDIFRNGTSVGIGYRCRENRVLHQGNRNLVRPAAGNTVTGNAWKTRTGSGRLTSGIAERARATSIRQYFLSDSCNDRSRVITNRDRLHLVGPCVTAMIH